VKRLAWDDRALDDLDAIANYIAADSPRSAIRVVEYIRTAALSLETSPELGLACPEPGLREFILTRDPRILAYEIVGEEVRILAVFHHRQQRR
jgi:plasmid stabilization system protein ParE